MIFDVVIPARYGSQRFPGKPLVDLCGKPMITHVVARAIESGALRVMVATDDERIAYAARAAGAMVAMTGECRTGSDRVAEAVRDWGDGRIVVNVQGDEPLADPQTISAVANATGFCMATAADGGEGGVGVVVSRSNDAVYFSRHRLPGSLRHIGIYGYRVGVLRKFAEAPTGRCEAAENLEQLRAIELGIPIRVVLGRSGPCVDTPEDAEKVREILCATR